MGMILTKIHLLVTLKSTKMLMLVTLKSTKRAESLGTHLIVKIFSHDVNVSGLLHLFRALHAEADLGDLADDIGLAELFFNHLEMIQLLIFFWINWSFKSFHHFFRTSQHCNKTQIFCSRKHHFDKLFQFNILKK